MYIFLHAMHHQSCLVLHSSLVPYLSGAEQQQNGAPPEVARISAEVALEHARAISNLGADLMSLEWSPARIAPFVGYCMYVAAMVHMTVIARDAELAKSAHHHLVSALKVLKMMKPCWALLERLVSHFMRSITVNCSSIRGVQALRVANLHGKVASYSPTL